MRGREAPLRRYAADNLRREWLGRSGGLEAAVVQQDVIGVLPYEGAHLVRVRW